MFVVRHLLLAGGRLHLVELIVVSALVHDNAIAKNVLPSEGEYFAGSYGREDDRQIHRLRRLHDRLDHPADVPEQENHGRLDRLLPRELDSDRRIPDKHLLIFALIQSCAKRAVNQPNRLRRETERQLIEKCLQRHGRQFADLASAGFRQEVGLKVPLVLLTRGVFRFRMNPSIPALWPSRL
jgi:hypothetical protein